jgi:glycosyltransferase involved in cell wall biosynthesis
MVKEQWFYESHFPLNFIGYYFLERKWMSYYINIPTITVSDSSKKDLEDIGIKKIFLLKEGLNVAPLSELSEKEQSPTIIFLGRLMKYKLPEHALKAFCLIRQDIPNVKMWIIGDGYMRKRLEKKYKDKDIIFHGYVTNEVKYHLLSRAHLVLLPSVREGWGLVATESNAMGTPVVAYNVPGLKDSIIDDETGTITKENTPDCLASCAVALLKQPDLLTKYGLNALNYSKLFSWDNTADEFDRIIQSII